MTYGKNQDATLGYWYLHTNGERIYKPAIVVESGGGAREYFSGPFVKKYWMGPRGDDRTPEEKLSHGMVT